MRCLVLCVCCFSITLFPITSRAAILDRFGNVIPSTELITPGPNVQLAGLDLFAADLSGLDLSDANFGGSNLTNTDFESSKLIRANFQGASILGARSRNADFTSADLAGANLTGTSFFSSDLTDANFSDANISRVLFSRTPITQDQISSTSSFRDKNLSGVGLRGQDLIGFDFSNQNLADATLATSALQAADFTNANVRDVNFGGTSGFTFTQLQSTQSYQEGQLQGVILDGLDLTDWDMSNINLEGVWFQGANLSLVDFSEAVIAKTRFTGAISLTAEQIYATRSYQDRNLTGVAFNLDISNWDLSNQNLSRSDFRGENNLSGTSFEGATITGAFVNGMSREQFYSTASYKNGDLTGIRFDNMDLAGWDFNGQDLTDARFDGASIVDVKFDDADISRAFLSGGAFGLTEEQLYSTATYQQGRLERVVFTEVDMSGWDLASLDLRQSFFEGGSLQDADLTNAVISDVFFSGTQLTVEQIYSTASYQNGDLQGLRVLYSGRYDGIDFSNQNLSRADFENIDFVGASFENANLRRARINGDVADASLAGADLSFADFRLVDNLSLASFGTETIYNEYTLFPADFDSSALQFIPAQPGDTDFDGDVDFADFLALSSNFGSLCFRRDEWRCLANGDFDRNRRIDFADFLILSTEFGAGTNAQAVPEPSTWLLALFAMLAGTQRTLSKRPR